MVYQGNRWLVRDITIDGVSLITNYRAQFDRVIKTSSYRDLVVRMQERVGAEMPRPASGGELLGESEATALPLRDALNPPHRASPCCQRRERSSSPASTSNMHAAG